MLIPPELLALPRTAAEAREAGVARYFSGQLCPRRHLCARRVSMYRCVECNLERRRAANLRGIR